MIKKYFTALLILIFIMAVIPIAANKIFFKNFHSDKTATPHNNSFITIADNSNYQIPQNLTFTDTSSNKEISRSAKSIMYSLVGAAVDQDFTENEVKALAIAIHTQLCFENDSQTLAIDTQNPDVFLNDNSLKQKFGKDYTTLCSHCDNVYNALILNSNKPADLNIEYLKIKSSADTSAVYKAAPCNALSSDYSATVSVGKDEFFNTLKTLNTNIDSDTIPRNAVGEITYLTSGEVDTVNICGENFSGSDIAAAFNLPYRRFTLTYSLDEFGFTSLRCDTANCITPDTAKFMSLQGNTYSEILNYCYSN